MVDICDAYQRRQISRDEFKAALGRAGCPPGMEGKVIAMVEEKGMAAAPAAEPSSKSTDHPATAGGGGGRLPRGTSVMLSGLINATHLNGAVGVIKRFDSAALRYEVELVATKKVIRARAACVFVMQSKEDIGRDELKERTGCCIPGGSAFTQAEAAQAERVAALEEDSPD